MERMRIPVLLMMILLAPVAAIADDLTQMIQKDLLVLGYEPGNIQGEMTPETIVAISRFQAENDLQVTGESTPQLAGIIKAKMKTGNDPSGSAATTPQIDPATLQAAQQACLQEKVATAQASKKKKRGFGSLMKAVANTTTRFGNSDITQQLAKTSLDIYDANATARDWKKAAKDLGLTTDDIEACRSPSM